MVQKILEDVPQALDGVIRLVNKVWHDITARRWKTRERAWITCDGSGQQIHPCVFWALNNPAMPLLKWLVDTIDAAVYIPGAPRMWLNSACQAGNTKAIAWLISEEAPKHVRRQLGRHDVSCVAQRGDLACYTYVVYRSDPKGPVMGDIYKACRGGHLDTVQWIMSHCGPDKEFDLGIMPKFEECLLNACRGGHKQVADWLMLHKDDGTMLCCRGGHKHLADWLMLHEDDGTMGCCVMFSGTKDLMSTYAITAIRHGHLNLAKHLFNHWKCPVGTDALEVAVRKGNVEGFRFVWDVLIDKDQKDFCIRPWVCVELRHFAMLDLLAEKDCLKGLDLQLFNKAVRDDEHDLAMLQWLWKHCDQAAMAVELGGDDRTCNVVFVKALYSGHVDILDWMQPLGFGWELCAYSSVCYLERMAHRSQYKGKGTVWHTAGRHARGPKASLVWLHQQALVDLSEARVLPNGKIWFHLDCDHHQEKTNPGSWICSEIMGYEDTNQSMDDTPWSYSTEKATGEYLIARRKRK